MIYLYDTNTKQYISSLGSEDLLAQYKSIHTELQISYTTVSINTDYNECYTFDEGNSVWKLDNTLYRNYMIKFLLTKVQKVADTLFKNAPYLLMPGVSSELVDRYQLKYYKAKDNDTAFFECESTITGVSVDDLINEVLNNGKPIEDKYNDLVAKIEGFRRGCKLLTFGKKYPEAKRGIIFLKNLANNLALTNKAFLDYCAGNVTTIGDEDSNSSLASVIDIIGYVPEEQ